MNGRITLGVAFGGVGRTVRHTKRRSVAFAASLPHITSGAFSPYSGAFMPATSSASRQQPFARRALRVNGGSLMATWHPHSGERSVLFFPADVLFVVAGAGFAYGRLRGRGERGAIKPWNMVWAARGMAFCLTKAAGRLPALFCLSLYHCLHFTAISPCSPRRVDIYAAGDLEYVPAFPTMKKEENRFVCLLLLSNTSLAGHYHTTAVVSLALAAFCCMPAGFVTLFTFLLRAADGWNGRLSPVPLWCHYTRHTQTTRRGGMPFCYFLLLLAAGQTCHWLLAAGAHHLRFPTTPHFQYASRVYYLSLRGAYSRERRSGRRRRADNVTR